MIITKTPPADLSEIAVEDYEVIKKIENASINDMLQLMKTQYPKSWDISRPNLKYYIPVLNRMDKLFEDHITKYKLDIPVSPLMEVNTDDEDLVVTLLNYSHQLLEYSENKNVYESHDRLFRLLQSTSISIKLSAIRLMCCVQERFLHHNPMKYSIPKANQEQLLRIAKSFPPQVPVAAPSPVRIEVHENQTSNISPRKAKKHKKNNKKEPPSSVTLWDCFRSDYNVPSTWKQIHFEYYKTANTIVENKKSAKGMKESTSKSEVAEGLHFFNIKEETIKKLSYQQIYDKAMLVIPKNRWFDFVFAVAIAKAYCGRSYESIRIREMLVTLKCLTLACGNTALTNAVFDDEPYLLNHVNDLINLDNNIPRDIRLVAMRFLVNTSAKRNGASDLIRSLGGNVSHGLLFHILRTILKRVKEGTYDNDQKYLNYFYNIVANMLETKSLAICLRSAGLISLLFEFLKLRNEFRMTRSGPLFLIEVFCQTLPEAGEDFISQGGFQVLIDLMKFEVDFAIDNPNYDGGAPKKPEFTHSITTRQVKILTSLLKLVSTLVEIYPGDRIRNLYDSPIQKSLIKVLQHPSMFGHEMVNCVIRVMTSIINSEPTSFTIFRESGLIQTFIDEFDNLLLPNADLILDLTDAINAVALNNDGQATIVENKIIKKLLSVFYRPEMCKVLCVNADVSHFGLAIDELSRHHPELKEVIDEEILHLIDTVPASLTFNDVDFYKSKEGCLYKSRDEKEIFYEEGCSELSRWETSKPAEVIQCSLMFLSHLFENNESWKTLFSKIDMKNLFRFVTMEKAPFDSALSQSMYHFRNIIRAIDQHTDCYSMQTLFDVLKEKIDEVRAFIDFSENDNSYFDQFEEEVDHSIPSNILSNLGSINSLLYIYSELYGKLRQTTKAPYILEKLSAHSGLDLLFDLTAMYKRLAIEEVILFHRTPRDVAGNAFTPVNSSSLKYTYVTAPAPEKPKFDGTSAKFKNSSVLYFHASRIKFWLRSIFNSLVISPEKRSDSRALGMTPTHFVTICHNLANFFMKLVSETEFEDLEIQTGYLLIICNQIYELMCHKSNTTVNLQGIITICILQNENFSILREKIVDYFSIISSLDVEDITKWSTETYTSVELASSSITLLEILLKMHSDINSWDDATQAQIITNRCYCDIPKVDGAKRYDKEISLTAQLSVQIVNFLVYHHLFSIDHLNILEHLGPILPKKLARSIIDVACVAFKLFSPTGMKYGGKLYSISGSTTCPSDDKIDYLIDLGVTREHAIEILLFLDGRLDVTEEELSSLEDNFTDEDIPYEEFAARFAKTPYCQKLPKQIKICNENDGISIETFDDLSFHRGANELNFIQTSIKIGEYHPDLTPNILTSWISVFGEDSLDIVLTSMFTTLKSFDLHDNSEISEKSFAGVLDLTAHLIVRMRNKTQEYTKIDEILSFVAGLLSKQYIKKKWFVNALDVFGSVFSVSKAPFPKDCRVKYRTCEDSLKDIAYIPDMYVVDSATEKIVLDFILGLETFTSEKMVSSVCKLLLFTTASLGSEVLISSSHILKALLNFLGQNKTDSKTQSLVINVIRRSMENEVVLRNYISKEVERMLATKKFGLNKPRNLELILSELSSVSFRNSELLVEYLAKDIILTHAVEPLKFTVIKKMNDDQKKIAATSIDVPDAGDIEMSDTSADTKKTLPTCGIMHLLLSELKEITKCDLTVDERIAGEEKRSEDENSKSSDLDCKDLLDRNLKLQYTVFLLQTIAELLFSYSEAKTSFLTFSKKSVNADVSPKPRSTALNMLIHRFVTINPFENDLSAETKIKSLLSTLASACILGLNSTVPVEGVDFSEPKNCDPDVTFARKFTVDILIKVVKEAQDSNKSSLIRYGKIVDVVRLVNNSFSRDFGKIVNLSTDRASTKHDSFQFAKVLLDKKFPSLITDVLATLDVNFPYTEDFTEVILKCITKFGKIKVDYQELFKEGNSTDADEEVYEDEDEMDEDTPNLLRNSTLGMYDIGEIEDEDGNSDFVDEFLDDEDIEIVIDDNEAESESDADHGVISAVDSDIEGSDLDHEIDQSNSFMNADDDEDGNDDQDDLAIYGSDNDSLEGSIVDEAELISDDSQFDDISDDYSSSDELLEDNYVVDLATDDEDVSMSEDHAHHSDDGEDEEDAESDNDSVILDEWLENHELEQARRRGRNRSRGRIDYTEEEEDSQYGAFTHPSGLRHRSITIPAAREGFPSGEVAVLDTAQSIFGRSHNSNGEEISDLRRLLDPLFSRRGNNANVISIKSTGQRWHEYSNMFNSIGYAMRVVPIIINKIYDRSHLIYEEETNIKMAIKERKRKEKAEKMMKKREEAAERERHREIEQDTVRNATTDLEPIMVEIGGRSVDISGTGIDPEFLLALPDEMREEVYAQHVQDSAVTGGEDTDDFYDREGLHHRHDFEDDDEEDDFDDESDDEEDDESAGISNAPFGVGLLRNLRYDFPHHGPFAMQRTNVNDHEEHEEEESPEQETNKSSRLYFTPMIDKSSVAALLKIVFVPQMYTKRELFFQAVSYLCLSKKNRSEIISILLYVLQEGLKDSNSLQNVYQQVCLRAYSLINPSFNKADDVLPEWTNFPVNSTTLIVATQAIDILQYLMENETTMRIHMLTEQDGISFMKKASKSGRKDKSYKYPINILLNLLDNKLIKNDANLMDVLSRTIQVASRPLMAIKAKLDEGDEKFKNMIQLPVIQDKTLRQVITILVADECPNKVFQQAIVSMQNLSVLPNARQVYPKDLSKKATHLSGKISKEVRDLIKDLSDEDESIPALSQFSSGSSDQAKLLRVLTALDYLYQDQEAEEDIEELKTLYKDSALGPLWGALSDCLKLLTADESKSYIAFILSPLIEALMVVCKHSKVERMDPMEVLKYEEEIKLDFAREPIESLFFTFTEEHKKILNHMIRSNPKLMSGPFSVLIRNPKVLEFDNKRVYFEEQLHKDDGETRDLRANKLEVKVRRDQVFLDTYRTLYFKPAEQVKKARLEVSFKGEEGVDAGGVTREWYQVLARQMFDPNYALFTPVSSDKSTFHPNRTSWVNPEHLFFFKFVGMIIGKAVNDGYMLDCHFSRAVFKSILGKSVSLKDMESMDLDYYKSLVWMLENDITDIIVETFSVEADDYGEHKVIELKPGGENIPVTEENKQEYVKLIVEYRLVTSVKNQMEKFLEGFFSIIPKELIKVFDEQELELLVSGMPDIDVDDWKNNTNYENYSASSKQVQWFWRAVKSFDADERAKLLQFATGTSKVPLSGFKELPGMNGISKFSIHRVYNSTDRLPTAHTCFNQIDLPEYESYTKLRNALILAIREGYEGFGFA